MNSDSSQSTSANTSGPIPSTLQERLNTGMVEELDVRPILAAGQEPFQRIMQAVDRLKGDDVFVLKAPFEPAPLYAVLGRKGFQHWTRQNDEAGESCWEIFFYREESLPEESDLIEDDGDAVIEIDVRGLEPPEPLERVMEAAERMAYGDVLRVVHHRNPLILFDVLQERGFGYRSEERGEDFWEIRIWRKK